MTTENGGTPARPVVPNLPSKNPGKPSGKGRGNYPKR